MSTYLPTFWENRDGKVFHAGVLICVDMKVFIFSSFRTKKKLVVKMERCDCSAAVTFPYFLRLREEMFC